MATAIERTNIIKLVTAMFNAAPGSVYLSELVTYFDASGGTSAQKLSAMATALGNTTAYRAINPTFQIASEFASVFLTPYGLQANQEAIDFITAKFNAGVPKGQIAFEATMALNDSTAAAFADARAILNNKTTVAEYFSVTKMVAQTDVSQLKAVIASVTAAASSVTAANAAIDSGTGGVAGTTFTLTAGGDTLDPTSATASLKTTAGDDTFRAPTDGFLTSADFVDGGSGTDSLTAAVTANSQTLAPTLKSIENITLTITAADTKTTTFNAVDTTGATTVSIKDAGAVSATGADELITVSNLAKTTTLGIVGGTASTGATSSQITATFASAAAADTQKVAISSLGKVGTLTLSTAETVEITATGTGTTGANTIGSLAATAVKTLNLKGSGDLTISASDLAQTVTVSASAATGVVAFTAEAATTSMTFTGGSGNTTVSGMSTGIVNVTTLGGADTVDLTGGASTATVNTGAGNDEVRVGVSTNVTAADAIVGGDGTDTIAITDATINATTKTTLALGVSGFEVLKTTATAEVTIDYNALSTYDVVSVTGASGATAAGAANSLGSASIVATMESTLDQLIVAAARIGQAGGVSAASGTDTGGNGGNGITVTPRADGGANIATLKFVGNADITGGAGGASVEAADTGGTGGSGLNASTIETLNIEVSGTNATGVAADTVTFAGGGAGAGGGGGTAGAAGSSFVVGTNATVNITSSLTGSTATVNNHIDLGTVVGTNAIIAASTFAGNLTVTAASGNVTINGGLGNDNLTGGAGTDTINGGSGADIITGGAAADTLTGGAGRDSFTIGTAGHSGATTFDTIAGFGKVTAATSTTQTAAMNNVAAFQATATAVGGAEADMLDMATTATLATAATGTDVSAGVTGGGTVTGAITAKGVVTVTGAQAANVDTLAEWVAVTKIMTAANNVAVFEFSGSTYVYQEGGTDDVVQLTSVTGVTGITLVGSSVAAAVGDVFVI